MKTIINIAHRGASGHAPENTLASFQKAIEMGAHMIELDVHLSLDKELVVIHDRSLRRTTGHRGSVGSVPLKKLKTLDAGSWFNARYRREKIPTLQEVFELIDDRVRLNIEIKKGLRAYPGLERRLLDCLDRHPQNEPPLLSCFDESVLQRLRKLDGDIPIGYLFDKGRPDQIIPRALKLGAASVHGPARSVSEEIIAKAHAEGLKAYVYTVNEQEQMRYWVGLGVDGIFTNYPDRLTSLLGYT
jgi:glycerophosphoryl diester phosphodiesterase